MASALNEYIANYGERLHSLIQQSVQPRPILNLQSQLEEQAAAGAPAAVPAQSALEPSPMQQRRMQALAQPVSQAGVTPTSQLQQPREGRGTTFRDVWEQAPEKERRAYVKRLEEALARGNQTIDSAYDQMIQQIGARPEGKLSRQDKAMLLMEFGLSLMANSAHNRYGGDLGGAIGASGLQTLQRYRELTQGPQRDYDRRVAEIEKGRAEAKARLAEKSALEDVAASVREDESDLVRGTFTADDGTIYRYNRRGEATPFLDEQGRPIRARDRLRGGRTFESEWRYKQYLEDHGIDPETGQPKPGARLSAEDLRRIKREALQYAVSSRGVTGRDDRTANQKNIEDLVARGLPEDLAVRIVYRLITDPRKAWEAVYRDLIRQYTDHEEAAAQADDIVRRLYGEDAIDRTRQPIVPEEESGRSAPRSAGGEREFASEEEVNEAFDRGELQIGDVVVVNGRRFRLQ